MKKTAVSYSNINLNECIMLCGGEQKITAEQTYIGKKLQASWEL